MKAGKRIKLMRYVMGYEVGYEEFVVEEFRYCLGVFESDEHRRAGDFTPLCNLYYDGPDSEAGYIPNFGEYRTNQVPSWIELADKESRR